MENLPYQVLFLIISISALAYLNRNNFGGPAQKVMRFWVPRPILIGTICIFLGTLFWITVNILLWQFAK